MQTLIPGLYASAPERLPFAADLEIRAFLLARKQGNLLVYSVGAVAADAQSIEDLGSISRHYLNHWHEAQFGCDRIASTFKAPLVCHENERQSVSETCEVAQAFSDRHKLNDDFEVIPTPGHTSRGNRVLVEQRAAPLPVHRRHHLPARRRLDRGGAQVERSCRLHREPRTSQRARFRCARAVVGDRRPALPRCHRPSGRPAPHRRNP